MAELITTSKMTTTVKFKNTLKRMILDSVAPEDYGFDCRAETDREKVHFIFDCFQKEYLHDYRARGYKGVEKTKILKEYLMGLPSCARFPFANYDILELGKQCGMEFATESEEDFFTEKYWSILAQCIMELGRDHGIDPRTLKPYGSIG